MKKYNIRVRDGESGGADEAPDDPVDDAAD